MKKITLMIAFVAFAFSAQAQNPFVDDMLFDVDATVCAGDGEGNCDPANSDIELTSQVTITLGENPGEIIISDITGGLYEQGYGESNQPATVVVDDANQTLTVTDEPDTVFGGDVINATGTYTTDANGDVDTFELTWSNTWGDGGTADYTFSGLVDFDAPDAAISPNPADGSTVFLSEGENQEGEMVQQYQFGWELPETSEDASSYLFELGIDNNVAEFSTTVNGNSLLLSGLELSSTYFWRITSVNAAGSTVGSVWSFTTEDMLSDNDFEMNKVLEHYYADNKLTLESNEVISNVSIYNMLGQEMLNTELSNNNESINVSSFSNGMYITKVTIGDKTETFKFIKK